MTMNRVQFQPGLSMAEFMDRYGSDDKCEAALQEQRLRAGTDAPPGRLLQDRLAGQAQAHGGHARAGRRSPARGPGGDRRRLPRRRALGRQGRARLGDKVPFVAAVQTTPDGQPQFVCLRQQPFTHEEVAVFAARSIAPSATVVSDGLWCFRAV
jgi:ISXO2-like transposase domain